MLHSFQCNKCIWSLSGWAISTPKGYVLSSINIWCLVMGKITKLKLVYNTISLTNLHIKPTKKIKNKYQSTQAGSISCVQLLAGAISIIKLNQSQQQATLNQYYQWAFSPHSIPSNIIPQLPTSNYPISQLLFAAILQRWKDTCLLLSRNGIL